MYILLWTPCICQGENKEVTYLLTYWLEYKKLSTDHDGTKCKPGMDTRSSGLHHAVAEADQ